MKKELSRKVISLSGAGKALGIPWIPSRLDIKFSEMFFCSETQFLENGTRNLENMSKATNYYYNIFIIIGSLECNNVYFIDSDN